MSRPNKQKNGTKPTVAKTTVAAAVSKKGTDTTAVVSKTVAPQNPPASAKPAPAATLQQQRAAFALQRVQTLAALPAEQRKNLATYAAKMPFMVHANGLGQTAAFYRAKKDTDPHRHLYRLLEDWLTGPDQPFHGHSDLLTGITQTGLDSYMAAQAEAMLFLSWVKQFAAAFLDD